MNNGEWEIVSEDVAREKASQCLRDTVSIYLKEQHSGMVSSASTESGLKSLNRSSNSMSRLAAHMKKTSIAGTANASFGQLANAAATAATTAKKTSKLSDAAKERAKTLLSASRPRTVASSTTAPSASLGPSAGLAELRNRFGSSDGLTQRQFGGLSSSQSLPYMVDPHKKRVISTPDFDNSVHKPSLTSIQETAAVNSTFEPRALNMPGATAQQQQVLDANQAVATSNSNFPVLALPPPPRLAVGASPYSLDDLAQFRRTQSLPQQNAGQSNSSFGGALLDDFGSRFSGGSNSNNNQGNAEFGQFNTDANLDLFSEHDLADLALSRDGPLTTQHENDLDEFLEHERVASQITPGFASYGMNPLNSSNSNMIRNLMSTNNNSMNNFMSGGGASMNNMALSGGMPSSNNNMMASVYSHLQQQQLAPSESVASVYSQLQQQLQQQQQHGQQESNRAPQQYQPQGGPFMAQLQQQSGGWNNTGNPGAQMNMMAQGWNASGGGLASLQPGSVTINDMNNFMMSMASMNNRNNNASSGNSRMMNMTPGSDNQQMNSNTDTNRR
jgi:hypothetical protein